MAKKQSPGHSASTGSGDRTSQLSIRPGLTIRAIEIFVTVGKSGSMSAAAERLSLSQPAISQAIGIMENALGIQLFDRSFRPPAMTLQATALMKYAEAIIDSIEKFDGALRLGHMAQLPSLRIGMLNSFAATMGPFIIDRLQHIAAELTVDSGYGATRLKCVADREFDFIVTSDESPPPPEVQMLPILTEPMLVVYPESYKGDPTKLQKLSADLDLIRFGRDPFLISRIDQSLRAKGIAPPHRYHLDTNEAALQMVAAGSGWTILPPLAIYRALGRGEAFRVALYPEETMTRTLMVVLRNDEGIHVAEQIHAAAVGALRQHFLPRAEALMPQIAKRLVLHELGPLAGRA
jgi:DNA-binding transcriptional LysR family regulator